MRDITLQETDEFPIIRGLAWEPYLRTDNTRQRSEWMLHGPFCPNCHAAIYFHAPDEGKCQNSICGKTHKLTKPFDEITREATEVYRAYKRSNRKIFSLDLPLTIVESKNEDDNYWVLARIGQKNGKKMGVVFMGEKLEKQDPKDKTQFFIDFDDEQVRFDKSNMPPLKLLSKIEVEFPSSKVEIVRKENEGLN